MKITVSTGSGEGATSLAAFDQALLAAGAANYNLVYLSSVIPAGSIVERSHFVTPAEEYGHRLYVVMACQHETQAGKWAWAGLGWTQNPDDGRGLFVEIHAEDRSKVEKDIQATLEAMISSRAISYGAIEHEILGAECRGIPLCVVALAIYKSEGWD